MHRTMTKMPRRIIMCAATVLRGRQLEQITEILQDLEQANRPCPMCNAPKICREVQGGDGESALMCAFKSWDDWDDFNSIHQPGEND